MGRQEGPLERLWRHRIKRFIEDVVDALDIGDTLRYHILNDTINLTLDFMHYRPILRVYLYDIALACLLMVMERYGRHIPPVVLIGKIARRKLKKRVTFGKVLRVLNFIKETTRRIPVKEKTKRITINSLRTKVPWETIREILSMIDKVAIAPSDHPRVLGALVSYIVLRDEGWSSADIERAFNVSRFTVLRNYKKVVFA